MHCIGDGSLSVSVVFLLLSFVIHIHYYASTTTAAEAPAYPYIKLTTTAQAHLPPNPYQKLTNCTSHGRCNSTVAARHPDSISYGQEAKNLTSKGGTFVLGFFERRRKTYLGIWYGPNVTKDDDVIIVWVGNRDAPMPLQGPSAYSIRISTDGNAKVFDSNNYSHYWSTSFNSSTMLSRVNNSVLQLSDAGNLILEDRGSKGGRLWQSFQSPTDTFLPGMDITGVKLVSWKTPEDPAQGDYSFQKDAYSDAMLIYNTSYQPSTPYWSSTLSPLNGHLTSYFNKNTTNHTLTRVVTSSNGNVQLWELNQKGIRKWKNIWAAPKDRCDLFDPCGNFGVCDAGNRIRCKCLPGYEPYEPDKWQDQDFSSGCSNTHTRCGGTGLILSLPMVKLPPATPVTQDRNETDCRGICQNSCTCTAYSFNANKSTCQIWNSDLTHIQEEYSGIDSQTLYIHVNQLDIGSGSRTCDFCGTNVIPYPLSTNHTCGDPAYLSFQCNNTNGQVYFKPPSGKSYKVSLIDPESRKIVIQLGKVGTSGICNTTDINFTEFSLSNTSPFNVTSCSVAPPNDIQPVNVELSWKPPPPPACNSSEDCTDWRQTTCADDMTGKNVCTCAKGFDWDSLYMNCTEVHHRHMPLSLKVGVATASGIVLLLLGSFLFILCLRRKRAIQRAGLINQLKTDDVENIDIPFIDYQSILAATDNFSDSNKLGAGGFGPVYKGKLSDGTEVAVKRLSAASAQGIEEFRNEVILIAKLQHRNLVRVLGYSMKEDEKILIYEYMPNKCLSSYIFDHTTSTQLDWTKRLYIILGIARGLVYLHQDSRLRIIHRDLKPSNILLDEELNPKISDFGLARIVAGSEIATSTAKVVGTYGYMSPEYALHGYFSIKSDVYSFGIILLEVISGRRCTSLLQFDNILISLLGYAWTLWDQEKALELVDESIVDSCDSFEVTRCINVGLLCLQEDPSDRPTMATVLLMLGGDTSLPHPNQPVFVARKPPLQTASSSSSSSKLGTSTSNVDLSATLEGR